jgi:hypothetical protein
MYAAHDTAKLVDLVQGHLLQPVPVDLVCHDLQLPQQ